MEAPLDGHRQSPASVDGLVDAGVPRREATRLAVHASLQEVLEVVFERWGRFWVCALLILFVGMFGVLIWSQSVYDKHRHDQCDEPLAFMLQLISIIVVVQIFQRELIRHVLCYNAYQHGPIEPCRVVTFRRASFLAAVGWPMAAAWMLIKTQHCSKQLVSAVQVIIGYYLVITAVVVLLPAVFLPVMLCLVRRGLVRAPRSRDAAPEGLLERLPRVEYDPDLFNDEAVHGYSSACPICLDDFDSSQPISKTPCTGVGHAFHTECLRGWLQLSRACPLCRQDLVEAIDGQGAAELGERQPANFEAQASAA